MDPFPPPAPGGTLYFLFFSPLLFYIIDHYGWQHYISLTKEMEEQGGANCPVPTGWMAELGSSSTTNYSSLIITLLPFPCSLKSKKNKKLSILPNEL